MKYLEQQNCPERVIPDSAANVFQQNETYRKYLQNLDVTVALYNKVRETIMDVEYPLIEKQLNDIDQQLEKAISQLNWTSTGTYYIVSSRTFNIDYLGVPHKCPRVLKQSSLSFPTNHWAHYLRHQLGSTIICINFVHKILC